LNDLRSEKMNRVKIVEREKSALEGRKKEADGYLRDQNELVHNKSALCQVNIHQSSLNAEIYRDAAVSTITLFVLILISVPYMSCTEFDAETNRTMLRLNSRLRLNLKLVRELRLKSCKWNMTPSLLISKYVHHLSAP
jgi:hypothetical protein